MKISKFFLTTLLMFFVACRGPSSPEEIAVEALKASTKGDVEKLAKYFGIEKRAKDDSEKTAAKGKLSKVAAGTRNKAEKMGGLKEVKVLESSDEGEMKIVKVQMTFGNGENISENIKLEKIDGEWFIKF